MRGTRVLPVCYPRNGDLLFDLASKAGQTLPLSIVPARRPNPTVVILPPQAGGPAFPIHTPPTSKENRQSPFIACSSLSAQPHPSAAPAASRALRSSERSIVAPPAKAVDIPCLRPSPPRRARTDTPSHNPAPSSASSERSAGAAAPAPLP